ncbi:hypothetical protein GOBAR_AA23718 [Gossypium barbadense]|uniref:Protein FAR1-RELATED SEQUENCE n=1 Tax=Gossypium barbadense TaxID=3634 RepID=A0A2P5X0W0_GOSBA|nr:hypothetical protein GOBAR_AA23718 [Gossypium barbadense]
MDSSIGTSYIILASHRELEFESHEAAYSYYKDYAKSVGFGTAKLSSRRSRVSKEFIDAKFTCIRYGNKQQSDDAINPRPSPKIGCKASMHVKRRQDGKWYVYSFIKEHNHELLPAQAHFFRSHRNVDPLKTDVGRKRKNLASVSKLFSAYQNIDFLEGYMRNQHDKGRSLVLEEGDAQVLLELLMHMQEENPSVYSLSLQDLVTFVHLEYLSLWHDSLMLKLDKCIYRSWTEDQFEKRWWKMVDKFHLREMQWVLSLYEDRKRWVPVFMRDISFAGFSTALRSDSLSSSFDKYVHGETSLREFIEHYRVILEDRYEEEAKADFNAWHETPELKSPSPFEKQISLVYTHEVFKKFQVEVLGAAACHLKKENEDQVPATYSVKDFEDNQNYMVEWNEAKSDIYCSCRSFEYKGYLCRHAIVVLQMSGVFNIPSKYILQRWTNAALSRLPISQKLDEVQSKVRRYNDLCRRAIILSEEGSLSQESYNLALSAIKEALKQCASVNNSVENEYRPNTSIIRADSCVERVSQFANTQEKAADPRMTNTTKTCQSVETALERQINENNATRKGKVSFAGAVNVGSQDGFHQMEMSDMRPTQLHNVMPPTQLHNMVPTMFTNVPSTHFQNVAATHLHDNRLHR